MRFSCLGKVFIIGEYSCIEGGPALVGTLSPRFSLEIVADDTKIRHPSPFEAESPAGLYLAKNAEALHGHRLVWSDPHNTPIGVGSSSAQFALSVAAVALLEEVSMPGPHEVLDAYWETVGLSQGLRPSGADVVAQWMGGPLVVRNKPFALGALTPWKGHSAFLLAYTGKKTRTHEHLEKLKAMGFPGDYGDVILKLNEAAFSAIEAWRSGEARVLGSALKSFQHILNAAEIAPKDMAAKLEKIEKWPGVLGCKGSGAQGGDCALLLVEESAIPSVSDSLKHLGWTPIRPDWSHEGLRRLP